MNEIASNAKAFLQNMIFFCGERSDEAISQFKLITY